MAALKNVGLSVQTYSFSANETGVHGVLPVPVMREADRFSGTATCDAGWSQSCAVFGMPFASLNLTVSFFAIIRRREKYAVWLDLPTDTWNSFVQRSEAAKRLVSGFYLFCYS